MGAVHDEAGQRLPDSWLSDLAILFAAALRRTPRRILACMALVFAVFLIAPFDFVIPVACAFGAVAGTLETVLRGRRFPVALAGALGFASLVAIVTYDQITVLRFDTLSGAWFKFVNSSLDSELHAQLIGLPGRIVTLSVMAVLASVAARLGPRVGRVAAGAAGVVAVLISLSGVFVGFTDDGLVFGDVPWIHGSALAISLILLVLGARPARTRWIAVVAIFAVASALGFNSFSTVLVGIVATIPLAGRTVAALAAEPGEVSADAAAARLTARFARRPLRASAVAYLYVALTSWFLDWAALRTGMWLLADQGTDSMTSFAALAVVVPPIWQTAIVIAALGALHAEGLATHVAAPAVWVVAPFVLGFAFFGILDMRRGIGGGAPLAMMSMFYPFGLVTLAGVALSVNAGRAVRIAMLCGGAGLCLLAPLLAAYRPGAEGYLAAALGGESRLLITAGSIPFLLVTGVLATTRRPRGTAITLCAGALLVALFALVRPSGGDLMLFASLLPEALAAGVAIVAILIARRLHGVSPLPDDHAVFVLRRERQGATG